MAPGQGTSTRRFARVLGELAIPQWKFAQIIGKPEATVNRWINGLTPRKENQALILAALKDLGETLDAEDLWRTDESN